VERLAGPYEIMELRDRETIELHIVKWEHGEVIIHPRHEKEEKVVQAVRVFVPEAEKEFFPYYWDITSNRLRCQLLPWLEQPDFAGKRYKITKYGIAPIAHFTLEVIP